MKNYILHYIIEKARQKELKYRVNREIKKKIKRHTYRLFLQNPTRPLPEYHTLRKWSITLIVISIICLILPSMQIVFFYGSLTKNEEYPIYLNDEITYEQVIKDLKKNLCVYCGIVFVILMVFALVIDNVIYKRWNGYKKTLINWGLQ